MLKRRSVNLSGILTGISMLVGSTTSASALEGIASEGKPLGGLSDSQCVKKVDEVISIESREADTFLRLVSGQFTRKMVFTDGSVDFACFPDQVVIIVYYNNAGNDRAEQDLLNFLAQF